MLRRIFLVTFIIAPVVTGRIGGGRGRGGSHVYPRSPGLSGYGGGIHGYSSVYRSASHVYPGSLALSGTQYVYGGPKTIIPNRYRYNPPQEIKYGPVDYPVFHGQLPVYVYEYQNSPSRFNTLLTGLALYNLGIMTAQSFHPEYRTNYVHSPTNHCKFGVRKANRDYDETAVNCQLLSSFIWEEDVKYNKSLSKSIVVSLRNATALRNLYYEEADNGFRSNEKSVIVTQTNDTVVDPFSAKGPSIPVTPGMECYLIRMSPKTYMHRVVPCDLLQTYALKSMHSNAIRLLELSWIKIAVSILVIFTMNRHVS